MGQVRLSLHFWEAIMWDRQDRPCCLGRDYMGQARPSLLSGKRLCETGTLMYSFCKSCVLTALLQQRHRERDRDGDRQRDGDRRTGRLFGRQKDRKTDRRQTDRDREIERDRDRDGDGTEIERDRNRQMDRQAERD